jgi:plastocyanin
MRVHFAARLAATVGVVSAFAGGSATAGSATSVRITRFAFSPQELTVAPGTTVTWTNQDEAPHTVTGGELASPGMDTGDRYEHAFVRPGDYPYVCAVHPFMTGVVHVRGP